MRCGGDEGGGETEKGGTGKERERGGHWLLIAGVAAANQFQWVRDQSCPASITHTHTRTHTGGKAFITEFGEETKRKSKMKQKKDGEKGGERGGGGEGGMVNIL